MLSTHKSLPVKMELEATSAVDSSRGLGERKKERQSQGKNHSPVRGSWPERNFPGKSEKLAQNPQGFPGAGKIRTLGHLADDGSRDEPWGPCIRCKHKFAEEGEEGKREREGFSF